MIDQFSYCLTSPYLCMAAASLKLISRKLLHLAHLYVVVMLALMTLIELPSFKAVLELMALGNIVAGGLWMRLFQSNPDKKPVRPANG